MPAPGTRVAWWDSHTLRLAIVLADEGRRVRLLDRQGRERRVPPNRVALEIDRRGDPAGGTARAEAREELGALEARVEAAAADVDVDTLWELARESGAAPPLEVLARLALDRDDGEGRASVILALERDGVHFVRRGPDWEPRPAEVVDGIRRQRARETERVAERKALIASLVAASRGRPFELPAGRETARALDALHELAVRRSDAPERRRRAGAELLDEIGLSCDLPEEGAFRLLRSLGRFESDDENLEIERFGLRRDFPEEVEHDARVAAGRDPARERRVDLTSLEVVTVDGPRTREIDDGTSFEALPDGGSRIGIHVADPSSRVEPGSAVDREARARGQTHYFPDGRLPMLPAVLSERAASLEPDRERPALSFLIDVDASGEAIRTEVVLSRVRSAARLDYDEADRILQDGRGPFHAVLAGLATASEARRRFRTAGGAVQLLAPEVDVWVDADGTPRLERIDPDSPSRRAVSEAMILAGEVAARWCGEHGVDVLHRRQPPPTRPPGIEAGEVRDAVAIRTWRRCLRRGDVGVEAGPHFALGLPAYVQVTSPLRRYQDLVAHRQIAAALAGTAPPYDRDELRSVAAATERAESDARRAEAASARFWTLRLLESRVGEVVRATVIEVDPRPVVRLSETQLEQPVPALAGWEPGTEVRLRVERVVPRADLAVLRPDTTSHSSG